MKKPWLFRLYRGLYYVPNYMVISISQYKDPYKPTSIMESRRVFYVAQVVSKIFDYCVLHAASKFWYPNFWQPYIVFAQENTDGLHPWKLTAGYPKWWVGKGLKPDKKWQFWVSIYLISGLYYYGLFFFRKRVFWSHHFLVPWVVV